ncbi:formylglycine-generating enzyme family protein [Myxococcota bacterium]|nr:formylglycine-generating enzyme family protein [Myxococcota bacterium]
MLSNRLRIKAALAAPVPLTARRAEATLQISEGGALEALEIHLKATHPQPSALKITLKAPWGEAAALHDHGAALPSAPLRASDTLLSGFKGKDPAGEWRIIAEEDTASEGARVEALNLMMTVLSNNKVLLRGDLLSKQGRLTEAMSTIKALEAKLYCLEACPDLGLSSCHARDCDGAARTCQEGAARPDGAACLLGGELGRCVGGACCQPKRCAALGRRCGVIEDGCGGWLDCAAETTRPCACAEDDTCLRCGGVECPALPGFVAACNAQARCEYAPAQPQPWQASLVWIWAPPGLFAMGAPRKEKKADRRETPLHDVLISEGYFINKHEVSVEVYAACVAEGACAPAEIKGDDGEGWGLNTAAVRPGHPQNGLSWSAAAQVCGWLGGRLPSEAEWAYAAKGSAHRRFPWGDTPEPQCEGGLAIFKEDKAKQGCGGGGTWPIGGRARGASAMGAEDMAGGLWEWTQDCRHDRYLQAPRDGSAWEADCRGRARMIRGGAFNRGAAELRSAHRASRAPDRADADIGVRCAR